ncbi:MAG: PilZ domain-containing protein [Candidatus Omnitrophota bacterium]
MNMSNLEQGYPGEDRRRFPRVNATVQYQIIEQEYSKKAGNTKNISVGGIAFFAKDKIRRNSLLSLSISLPDETYFQAKAQVVWCDPM